MPEVVVSDPELSVFGPVDEITVSVDIGQTGTRGSKQFVGAGAPSGATITETPLANDLYLDVSNSYLYQYIDSTWTLVGKFAPTTYNVVEGATFSSGSATLTYDIVEMFGLTEIKAGFDFVIQHNIRNKVSQNNIISSSVNKPTLSGTDLSFTIKAKYLDGTTWTNLSGQYNVMLSISLGEDNAHVIS